MKLISALAAAILAATAVHALPLQGMNMVLGRSIPTVDSAALMLITRGTDTDSIVRRRQFNAAQHVLSIRDIDDDLNVDLTKRGFSWSGLGDLSSFRNRDLSSFRNSAGDKMRSGWDAFKNFKAANLYQNFKVSNLYPGKVNWSKLQKLYRSSTGRPKPQTVQLGASPYSIRGILSRLSDKFRRPKTKKNTGFMAKPGRTMNAA